MSQRAIARADRILDLLARSKMPLTLDQISSALELPRSTAFDLLGDLLSTGFLQISAHRYSFGSRVSMLQTLAESTTVPAVSHPTLLAIARESAWAVALAEIAGPVLLYVDQVGVRGPGRLSRIADLHLPRPVLQTAAGRVILANMPAEVRRRMLHGAASAEQQKEFRAKASTIRRNGYLFHETGLIPGLSALAVPVPAALDGVVNSAVVLFMPRGSTGGRQRVREVVALVQDHLRQ